MPNPKNIVIFGSTGSIGRNCLEVAARFPGYFKIVGLAAKNDFQLLAEQAHEFHPEAVAIGNREHHSTLGELLSPGITLYSGEKELPRLLEAESPIDLAVNAMVGAAGLIPTIRILEKGINLALANKESLVAGGEIVLRTAEEHGAALLPIDSEHSAIFQCLLGEDRSNIDELILTASGGPFLKTSLSDFPGITPEMALKHPNWDMGPRITIDSATMVNKGLEVIEARWLFNIHPERIKVVIHPQSVVHSMVRFTDGSYLAQMGAPDMRLPIQFALTYPERLPSPYCRLDFTSPISIDFQPVPIEKFSGLELAYRALEMGGLAPAVLNAADEAAVSAFLQNRISFDRIAHIIESALNWFEPTIHPSVEDILKIDKETRNFVHSTTNNQ
ncbi:MAG: 1-deoxy-D-xylulose-5-phosphate reductoisomerase [candidate division Zixibacteria bacterium]|nr:1-deoxy-D-xylulose-5-phosphate reductoisomerase [Candidatus Tariuqbacter arcticus]